MCLPNTIPKYSALVIVDKCAANALLSLAIGDLKGATLGKGQIWCSRCLGFQQWRDFQFLPSYFTYAIATLWRQENRYKKSDWQ